MTTIVCPYCRAYFRDSETRCPKCGRLFDPADWPVAEAYSPDGSPLRLTISTGDFSWSPPPGATEMIVGRAPGKGGLTLDNPAVSREHLRVFLENGSWRVASLGKSFAINGEPFSGTSVPILSGDVITVEPFDLSVTVDSPLDALFRKDQPGSAAAGSVPLRETTPVCIGSDPNRCDVVIRGAAPRHAVVYYRRYSKLWWLTDCGSPGGTMINGEFVHGGQLFPGDRITVAGVDVFFDFGALKIGEVSGRKVEVAFDRVSVAKGGKDILKDISCPIRAGEFVGVLGPSGCGKSSLIQRLVGLGAFDSGEIRINGVPYTEAKARIQSITAYVPQDVALHEDLTLKEELEVFRLLHLRKDANFAAKVDMTLKLVGLDEKRASRIGALSGGEKRRAAIALELLRDPQLLVLDEPTAGLDPATETDIMRYLRRIANQGKTVICSTHIMGNLNLFDKALFMAKGRMVFYGTPQELLGHFHVDSPQELYRHFGAADRETIETEAEKYQKDPRFKKYGNVRLPKGHIPEGAAAPSPLQQAWGYLLRQILEYFSFRHARNRIGAFFGSAVFTQTILLPLLTALVLKTACAKYFIGATDQLDLAFFTALAVFWFGLNGNIRELVRERTPWRCLEHLEHVPLESYLAAKYAWAMFTGALQLTVFSCVIFLTPCFKLGSGSSATPWPIMPDALLIWFVVTMIGATIALTVSAISKKENQAIVWLPILLIPVLFFSYPIMRDELRGAGFSKDIRENYYRPAMRLQQWMPCYEPQFLTAAINARDLEPDPSPEEIKRCRNRKNDEDKRTQKEKKQDEVNRRWKTMLLKSGIYIIATLLAATWFQYRNERDWEGR